MSLQASIPRVVAFTGSTRRPSKSRALAEAIGAAAQAQTPLDIAYFDVVDAGPGLGAAFSRNELSEDARKVVEAVEQADAVIAVTPVYKGSYTGLFKHLFDFIDPNALAHKPVVIGATGGGHRHALIVEHQLRPLFGFFSALIVPTSVYASDHEFADGEVVEPGVLERVGLAGGQLAALLATRHKPSSPPELKLVEPGFVEGRAARAAVS